MQNPNFHAGSLAGARSVQLHLQIKQSCPNIAAPTAAVPSDLHSVAWFSWWKRELKGLEKKTEDFTPNCGDCQTTTEWESLSPTPKSEYPDKQAVC